MCIRDSAEGVKGIKKITASKQAIVRFILLAMIDDLGNCIIKQLMQIYQKNMAFMNLYTYLMSTNWWSPIYFLIWIECI